jgi:hypothetical protein
MTKRTDWTAAAVTMLLIGAAPMAASAQIAQDPHHPEAQTPAQTPQTPAPGMGGQGGMMGMMGGQHGMMGGMSMMNMMGMMQMMGGSGGMMAGDGLGMAMADHVEGRIAFLQTELRITDAQTQVWDAFTDALRDNARNLGSARGAMMAQMGSGQSQTLAQRLDAQESWLTARLEGTRTLKAAFAGLYAALSAEQKTTADDLLAPHMGLMAMGQMGRRPQ